MPTNPTPRLTTGLSAVVVACLALTAFAGPVAAAPDPAKVEQRAEQRAARDAARTDRAAQREARKAQRAELREARKAALEQRKVDAKALREEARAAISALRDGFSAMSVEERKATLDEIRGVREGYQGLFLLLMASWRADRHGLLPFTLFDGLEQAEADAETGTEGETESGGPSETEETPDGASTSEGQGTSEAEG